MMAFLVGAAILAFGATGARADDVFVAFAYQNPDDGSWSFIFNQRVTNDQGQVTTQAVDERGSPVTTGIPAGVTNIWAYPAGDATDPFPIGSPPPGTVTVITYGSAEDLGFGN